MIKQNKTPHYRIKNWHDYNRVLIDRGNVTLWFSEEFIAQWYESQHTGKRGASNIYSDVAIECLLIIKAVFKLPLRATRGFGQPLVKLMNVSARGLAPGIFIQFVVLLGEDRVPLSA